MNIICKEKVIKLNIYRMSCKSLPSKNKHYTSIERKVFLQILNDYKHVIEKKKSDTTTLKDKELAWNEITNKYNQSTLIVQERTVAQLKKLWTNIKQFQRDALTKEKQSYMATGGGPPQVQINIDPDVANIAPHLMKTAPVSFTSNMSDAEINDSLISTIHDNTTLNRGKQDRDVLKELSLNCNILQLDKEEVKPIRCLKRKRNKIDEDQLPSKEETLRMERVKQVMDEEKKLAEVKVKHEQRMSHMKENHLKEMHSLELQHLKDI